MDLGLFKSIQSVQEKNCAKKINEIATVLQSAFEEVSQITLLKNFVIFQEAMKLTMSGEGSNQFKIPQVEKTLLRCTVIYNR